jgi:hypothetical protein
MGSTLVDMIHPDDDGLAYGSANGTRSGTKFVAGSSRNAPGERSDEKNRRFGSFGFARADASASSPDGSFRRVDAADDDAFEAHVRSLEHAVDKSFDAAEGSSLAGGTFGGFGSPDGRGAPGTPWSRRGATPGSERDPRVSPAYGGGVNTPNSAGSFGG